MIVIDPLLIIIIWVIQAYLIVIFVSVILSWLIAFEVVNRYNQVISIIYDFTWRLTEPALKRIRRFVPMIGTIDISPVVLILALYFLSMVIGNIRLELLRG